MTVRQNIEMYPGTGSNWPRAPVEGPGVNGRLRPALTVGRAKLDGGRGSIALSKLEALSPKHFELAPRTTD